MKVYKHTEMGSANAEIMHKVHLTTLQFRGQEVLIRHFSGDEVQDPFIMIPGFVAGQFKKETSDLPVTNVHPIADPALKQELSDFLRFTEGVDDVHFWAA